MKSLFKRFGGFLLIVLILVLSQCFYTVTQWEQALVLRFGEPVRTQNEWSETQDAGLKFKYPPPIERVVQFERRNLELDMRPQEILASDQERLLVDAFVRYRITDVQQYYQTLTNRRQGEAQMTQAMDSTLRDVLGRVDSNEIISGKRADLMNEIQDLANKKAGDDEWGLEIIDVRIRTADLPPENAERVYTRMRTDRERESAEKRAEGEKQSITIRAETDKTVTVTLAKAREQSEILKGEGEARRNAIFAIVHNKDPEFYAFYRSMEAYRKGLGGKTSYVLSPDSDFLGYLDDQKGPRR